MPGYSRINLVENRVMAKFGFALTQRLSGLCLGTGRLHCARSGRQCSFQIRVIQHHNPHFTAIAGISKHGHNTSAFCLLLHNLITRPGITKINKKQKERGQNGGLYIKKCPGPWAS